MKTVTKISNFFLAVISCQIPPRFLSGCVLDFWWPFPDISQSAYWLFITYFPFVTFFPESLRDYFGRYGDISEAMVMKDPTTRRSRWVAEEN